MNNYLTTSLFPLGFQTAVFIELPLSMLFERHAFLVDLTSNFLVPLTLLDGRGCCLDFVDDELAGRAAEALAASNVFQLTPQRQRVFQQFHLLAAVRVIFLAAAVDRFPAVGNVLC